MSMLLFVLHKLWSIIDDSGSVVSSVVSSHPALLSFPMLAGNVDRALCGLAPRPLLFRQQYPTLDVREGNDPCKSPEDNVPNLLASSGPGTRMDGMVKQTPFGRTIALA